MYFFILFIESIVYIYKVKFLYHMLLLRLFSIFFLFSKINILFGIIISTNFIYFLDHIN